MTTLKLFIEGKENSWTLKPEQEYIIGSDENCHIYLPEENLSSKHLKFKFYPRGNLWCVYNLDNSDTTYIDNQPLKRSPITKKLRISVNNKLIFVVIPENNKILETTDNNDFKYPIKKREINRNIFDKEDPEQLQGTWIRPFSLSFSYSPKDKNQSKLESVKEDLYKSIYNSFKNSKKDKDNIYLRDRLFINVINYIDSKYYNDRDRIYIELKNYTIRHTKITTLMRFFVNGDNLYLAADSYALGRLSKRTLIFQSIVLLILIIFIFFPMILGIIGIASNDPISQFFGTSAVSLFSLPSFVTVLYLYLTWIKFIRALSQGESLIDALRVNFPKNIKGNAFDLDDIQMFLKSISPLIISSLEASLEKHGLLDEDMITVLKDIKNNISQTTINVNTGGGGIIGSMIGGLNNAINNQSQTKG